MRNKNGPKMYVYIGFPIVTILYRFSLLFVVAMYVCIYV